ncbi:sensor histidine kinase [Streptomyces qinzhouensis]|uniref:histidine kinase n=1 Tax=Streptomyces qinzhouensis TaxID=2599401 RepID=A0A5B8JGJ3_9ACTN|nr:histidine kinase [Streptomyces qinzhouensis]QDY76573.1 sensor histidine kinase [Streptomyces qinzhouensis]
MTGTGGTGSAGSAEGSGPAGAGREASPRRLALRGARAVAGLAAGALTALVGLLVAVPAGLVLLAVLALPQARRTVLRPLSAVGALSARAELRRLERLCGIRPPAGYLPADALRYAVYRIPLGLLGGMVLGLMVTGLFWFLVGVLGWFVISVDYPLEVLGTGLLGAFLLVLTAQGVHGTVLLEERLVRRVLGPGPHEALRRRIDQLATSRSEVVDAVDEERRRIERDLHDGVQQRLVALGILLGRARRSTDPERAGQLLRQAQEESRRALAELREVAWRVHPAVLDEAGLSVALESVAERSPLPVDLGYDDGGRPPERRAGTVLYFVVSEAVTNIVKHTGATRIGIVVHRDGDTLRLTVEDDGAGGADPAGGGLTGLARRVAALDGRFGVHSPPGGPTTITAEVPCA